ncbi:hypothetical protein GQ53DRAFT_772888 [Thozetella sp. PMI_491]|nr:hypothetical protein GQ53DRAFT_772888 [Thozetella sp. PMI_491]
MTEEMEGAKGDERACSGTHLYDTNAENHTYIEMVAQMNAEIDADETQNDNSGGDGYEEGQLETNYEGIEAQAGAENRDARWCEDGNYSVAMTDRVAAFCFGASLDDLLVSNSSELCRPIALLEEGSSSSGGWRGRTARGALAARDLYFELKRPRFALDEAAPQGGSVEPDAERRLV